MKAVAAALAALAFSSCAAKDPAVAQEAGVRDIALKNAGFEQSPVDGDRAPGWACAAHSDPGSFRCGVDTSVKTEGRNSLRIERVRPEPWGLATQVVADRKLQGQRVRYSVSVRTEGATGAGGGAFLMVQGPGGATIAHQQKLEQGTTGWTRQALELVVPAGAETIVAGAILEGGGKLWIDAARIEVLEPLAKR